MYSSERPPLRGRLYRKRYIVPNAVTVGSMFCGFLSIIYSSSERFDKACIAIALAILLDGLDGRVARRLNATSKFGVEFDSLSDLISFGVAPAILAYNWCFKLQMQADEFGVLVSFIYVICAASRLARFNISDSNLKSFTGLPSPAAAGMVAALVNCCLVLPTGGWIVAGVSVVMLGLGYLMVSKIEFFSIKQLHFKAIPLKVRLGVAALIALLWYSPKVGLVTFLMLYVFSGPFNMVSLWRKKIGLEKAETIH